LRCLRQRSRPAGHLSEWRKQASEAQNTPASRDAARSNATDCQSASEPSNSSRANLHRRSSVTRWARLRGAFFKGHASALQHEFNDRISQLERERESVRRLRLRMNSRPERHPKDAIEGDGATTWDTLSSDTFDSSRRTPYGDDADEPHDEAAGGGPADERSAATPLGELGCFGELKFSESTADTHRARFQCLSCETDVKECCQLLLKCWQLKPPSVIISVTGSAQHMSLEPRLEYLIKAGLQSAAECTEAWVITGGTDSGVMAMCGEALCGSAERKEIETTPSTPLIGVVNFGTAINRELLHSRGRAARLFAEGGADGGSGATPSEKRRLLKRINSQEGMRAHTEWHDERMQRASEADQLHEVKYIRRERNSPKQAALEPHHTHFLLVDDGTHGKWYGPPSEPSSCGRRCAERLPHMAGTARSSCASRSS